MRGFYHGVFFSRKDSQRIAKGFLAHRNIGKHTFHSSTVIYYDFYEAMWFSKKKLLAQIGYFKVTDAFASLVGFNCEYEYFRI